MTNLPHWRQIELLKESIARRDEEITKQLGVNAELERQTAELASDLRALKRINAQLEQFLPGKQPE